MNSSEEIHALIDQLTALRHARWGHVGISYNGTFYVVFYRGDMYEADTLLDALRMAAADLEAQP